MSKSNSNSLFKNLAMLSSSMGLGMVLGMFLRLYLPRVLGVEIIGEHYYALSIASLAFTCFTLGIPNYIYKFVPVNNDLRKTHFSSLLNFQIIYGTLILTAIAAYLRFFASEYTLPVIFLCIYTLAIKLYDDLLKPFMLSLNKVKYMSVFDVGIKVVQLSVIVVVLYFYPTLDALCLSYALVWSVGSFSAFVGVRPLLKMNREIDIEKIKKVLIYCSPFMISSMLYSVYEYIDVYIMGNLASKVEVSYYGTVKTLEGILCFAIPILIQGLSPYLSKSLSESAENYDKKRVEFIRYVLGLVSCIGLGFIIMGEEIIYYLYGEDFMPGLKIVPFCAVTLILSYMNGLLAIFMNIESKGRVVAMTTLFSVVINGSLNIWFIPYFFDLYDAGGSGIGAAVTTNISEFLVLSGFVFAMGFEKFGRNNILRFLLILGIFITANVYYQQINELTILYKLLASVLILPLIAICLGCFQKKDYGQLKEMLTNRGR